MSDGLVGAGNSTGVPCAESDEHRSGGVKTGIEVPVMLRSEKKASTKAHEKFSGDTGARSAVVNPHFRRAPLWFFPSIAFICKHL